MTPSVRTSLIAGALWPGLGQLHAGRTRAGTCLAMGALGLADVILTGRLEPDGFLAPWKVPALLGWLCLWALGMGDLVNALVLAPARRQRADRLLRSGIAFLLRGELARAAAALERAVALKAGPAATMHLAETERRLGKADRAERRLSALAVTATDWQWEIRRAREALKTQGGN